MSNPSEDPPQQRTAPAAWLAWPEPFVPKAHRAASFVAAILAAWRRRRQATPVAQLSDHLLRDVGLERDQVEREF